jgi:sensor histidine kinase YesM
VALVFAFVLCLPAILRTDGKWHEVLYAFLHNFIYALCCWFVYSWLLNSGIWNSPTTKIATKIWFSFLCFFILTCAILGYDAILSNIHPDNEFLDLEKNQRNLLLLVRAFIFNVIIYFVIYYIATLKEKQKKSLEVEQLKQAQLQANISTLKEQLSPHFLFNTLNTLSLLTNEEPVKEYIDKLANIYRYTLKHQSNNVTTLKQELEFVESYLYIIKTRLENAIEIHIKIDETLLSSKIPPLTLQLLVENAIKHNIASSSQPLEIQLYNSDNEFIVVENNFQPKLSVPVSTETGLNNIRNRYQLLFEKDIEIEQANEKFIVKLPVVL